MASKRSKWVKSAFSQDLTSSFDLENPSKKLRSSSLSHEFLSNEKQSVKSSSTTAPREHQQTSGTLIKSDNWMESFAPRTIDDLAVHPKKIQEVQDWFRHCDAIRSKYPAQICLVTGPAGSGKTAAIRVLADYMKYQLVEWINPLDSEVITTLGDQENSYCQSQAETFKGFLFRSSRYKSVLESMDKRLVLVEDFPNAFIKDPCGFKDVLENYSKYGKSPLLFIVTDCRSKKLNISYNLFPDAVQTQFQIQHISFNPVSTSLMKKAMKRICALMSGENFRKLYKPPSADMVDSIGMAAQGDMRNALINLHFGSLKGAPSLTTDTIQATQPKTRSKIQKKLKSVGRDETITMMHALGRVFNPKYVDNSKHLLHSPEDITSAFCTEPKSFVDFVHTNYLDHFGDIDSVLPALDALCLSDMLLSEYREDSLGLVGLNVAVRGVMVSNKNPVTGWMPVRGPKRINVETHTLDFDQHISSHLFASDYRTYIQIIKNKTQTLQ